ncbi:hypothetical protein ACA910_018754 [Epithemia clementina (nom. ined.)]
MNIPWKTYTSSTTDASTVAAACAAMAGMMTAMISLLSPPEESKVTQDVHDSAGTPTFLRDISRNFSYQIDTTKLDAAAYAEREFDNNNDNDSEESDSSSSSTTTVLNWSGTHSVKVPNDRYWEPETIQEVERIVANCHKHGIPIRPMGSALSPNGLSFCDVEDGKGGGGGGGLISLAKLDEIIQVDRKHQTVTVQAGARVAQVVEALRPYKLTLPNLASIAEQQMGGFIQVGAHGTGRTIAPVDHYVTKLKLVTPGLGTLTLTKEGHGNLFELAKVGLGCLGVVVEVTMQCIPAHELVEHTFCLTRQQAMEQNNTLLQQHKHVRYMWIPYTDTVVVVTNDPKGSVRAKPKKNKKKKYTQEEKTEALRELLLELRTANRKDNDSDDVTTESLKGMGFADLRDAVLAYNPLDVEHVKRCNQAEAEFWKRSEGYQTKPSDELLQFECGGQQWVLEVCFPTGSQEQSNGNDMKFMADLLESIEKEGIPAPAPIEQRWTASSSSPMSPAHGPADGLHSWVGIINYLPLSVTEEDERQRQEITKQFKGPYCNLMRSLCTRYNATSHWAKLELPPTIWQMVDLKLFMEERFPVHEFNQARALLDPKNLMANVLINSVLGVSRTSSTATATVLKPN